MKTAIILLAIVGLAAAAEVGISTYSISSEAVKAIENLRDEMPCGFPEFGIPSLAPFVIDEKAVDIDNELFQMKGSVNNFYLNGLNDFEIDEFKIHPITSKATFRFTFNDVNVDTQYDLSVLAKKSGLTVNVVGNGPAKFAIKNMSIKGIVKYSLGVISGKLKVKSMNIRTQIGEVVSNLEGVLGQGDINKRMNDMVSEVVQQVVNENEDEIANTIEQLAVPKINEALLGVNIVDMISSIGGGEQKEKCNL